MALKNRLTVKYNGKEFDRTHGLDWYDYCARQYDPASGRFTSMDPLCEKYYNISPYSYCAGNPIRYVDPDGRAIYYGQKGNYMGDDGEDDDRVFLINSGVKTKNIDTSNLKNYQDKFTDITLFVNNFEKIQADVEKDDGSGGTKDCNNKEYGGYFDANGDAHGGFLTDVHKPGEGIIELNFGNIPSDSKGTYHTHPSGYIKEMECDGKTMNFAPQKTSYQQSPSGYDYQNAIGIGCVFARGNNDCYFYKKNDEKNPRPIGSIKYSNFKKLINDARKR